MFQSRLLSTLWFRFQVVCFSIMGSQNALLDEVFEFFSLVYHRSETFGGPFPVDRFSIARKNETNQ